MNIRRRLKLLALRRSETGQAALEFALVAPVLLAFILFIIDAGLFAYSYISVSNAVREGARCGAVGGSDSAIAARVTETDGGLDDIISVDPATYSGPNIGDSITVRATYTYQWLTPVNFIPGLNLGSFTYHKSATMRMETDDHDAKESC